MAEVTPLGAELACLEGADEEERRIPGQAAEAAKAARAAATRAARMADEHWSSTGPTQASHHHRHVSGFCDNALACNGRLINISSNRHDRLSCMRVRPCMSLPGLQDAVVNLGCIAPEVGRCSQMLCSLCRKPFRPFS